MKITPRDSGITTPKLTESRDFYIRVFGFEPVYEGDGYIQLRNGPIELGLLRAGQRGLPPVFQNEFAGEGVWFSWGVEDVDAECARVEALGVPIAASLRDEPWGERHFVVRDPNGIAINIATSIPPAPEFAPPSTEAVPASQ